jgi:large subunit ribosomal protein L10
VETWRKLSLPLRHAKVFAWNATGKDFFRKEVTPLAISKQRKNEVLDQYKAWLEQSQAVILVEYTGATMKNMDAIRAKIRESGGEFHVIKNTLARMAFDAQGLEAPEDFLVNSTAASFAFSDPAALAKALSEAAKGLDAIKVKGGFMDKQVLNAAQVKALAELPPLPVVRAQLLGVLLAPASKLVRTLAEPGRQVASVLKAYADQGASPAAA